MARTRKTTIRTTDFSSPLTAGSLDERLRSLQSELKKQRNKSRLFASSASIPPPSRPISASGGVSAFIADIAEYPVKVQKRLDAVRSRHVLMLKDLTGTDESVARHGERKSSTRFDEYRRKSSGATAPKVDLRYVEKSIGKRLWWACADFFISIPLAFLYVLRFAIALVRIAGWLALRVVFIVVYIVLYIAEIVVGVMRGIWWLVLRCVHFVRTIGRLRIHIQNFFESAGERLDYIGTTLMYRFAQSAWSYRVRPVRTVLMRGWYKRELVFLLISGAIIAPLLYARPWTRELGNAQGKVLGEVTGALATHDIVSIKKGFADATQSINNLGPFTQALVNATDVGSSARALLDVGNALASAGEIVAGAQGAMSAPNTSLLDKVQNFTHALQDATPYLKVALKKLHDVDARSLPSSVRPKVALLQEKLPPAVESLDSVTQLSKDLLTILGNDETKRYLLVFQNNNELRATGGFMGSVALIDIKNGKIARFEVPGGGTYDFQGQLKAWVAPPQPLWLVSNRWELQDANWWPSFPDSARKIIWFWEKSSGPSVDGVIAINASFMEQVLKVLGPVTLPSTGEKISANDFIATLQTTIASQKNTREPKKIVSELTPVILDALLSTRGDEVAALGATLIKGLAQKDVLFYFSDPVVQEHFARADVVGAMKPARQDYIMTVATNIQGGKTDGVIKQTEDVTVTITPDGRALHTLTIHRAHKGDPNNELEKLNNVSYMRVYVPQGSTLVSASGFNPPLLKYFKQPDKTMEQDADLARIETRSVIDEKTGVRTSDELGYTVFGNWMQVEPGEEAVASITYMTPFSVKPQGFFNGVGSYSMLLQKQPGMTPQDTEVKVILPHAWQVAKTSSSDTMSVVGQEGTNFVDARTVLAEDAYFGFVFTQ